MNTRGMIAGVIIATIIAAIIVRIAVLSSSSLIETVNPSIERTHGTISTDVNSPILGNPAIQITAVESGDCQCEPCHMWYHQTRPVMVRDYVDTGKVNLAFTDLTFLETDSITASMVTCCEDQDMRREYHDLFYTSHKLIDDGCANPERLKAFASGIGLDMQPSEFSPDDSKYLKCVQYNIQAIENGVRGTADSLSWVLMENKKLVAYNPSQLSSRH